MQIATPFDYADAHRAAGVLCSSLAFGDGDPAPIAAAASSMLDATDRHRRHLKAMSRRHAL